MADFRILIQEWFRLSKRNLPWRETFDPYKIWLSEVILQQTKVEQGLNYYLKFTEAFPTVYELASASEDEVLNLWQGLGYYSRARNLHFSAKQIVADFKGVFPKTYKDVLSLKGVGEYTAAAITSIAYGLPHAVVDGNVYRVLSRYLLIETPIDTTQGKKEFALAANSLLDTKNPGDHNQAIMELGALICLPKKPKCDYCPINGSCLAREKSKQLELPIKIKKTKVTNRFFNYLVFTDGKHTLLKKRTGKGIWQGLYDFPLIEKTDDKPINSTDLKTYNYTHLKNDGVFTHILSHQKIVATFWITTIEKLPDLKNHTKVAITNIENYPLPQLLIRYIKASSLFATD